MKLAKFLLQQKREYNGHLQNDMANMSIKKGLKLCKQLEKLTGDRHFFVLEVFSDGGFNIIQKNYWKKGEHPLGHEDRNVLGVSNEK